jgi:phosphoglycerol transferase MdoB-like AlkP superfamily enzyme
MLKKYNLLLFNIIFIIWLELVFKAFTLKSIFEIQTLFIIIFSISTAFLITIIESLFGKLFNKITFIVISSLIWVLFITQFIYYQYYETIFSIYSLFHGAQVLEFINNIIDVIFENIVAIILILIPLISMIIFAKRINTERKKISYYIILILWIFITFFGCLGLIKKLDYKDTYSSYNLYYKTHVPKLATKSFGIITEMRLDIKRFIFGFKEEIILNNKEANIEETVSYHMMDIDFDSLIASESNTTIKSMHEYFNSITPTKTNDYTGMFEGKNLIYIVAEAFSPMAINKDLTPTLYKLYNEGFKFKNFYTPVFYVSTSDGEYTTLTSLLPKDGTWSMSKSSNIYLPFVYGNIAKDYGYTANAYHDGLYTYYNRDESLPNMGYDFKACYHGLDINCSMWPESDIDMIEKSVGEYVNNDKFVVYYLTISGHLQYTYNGNTIATKNKSYVKDLNYSEGIQAYLATQIELDKAVEKLISELDKAGKLDDTVIAISADHYPYGLSNNQILEYADYIDDIKFDLHKNSFLLWNSTMEKSIEVNKYASSLDILPTMLNLFNFDYDSRLLMGKDILSDEEGLIMFNDRSWITSNGKYNATTKVFTPFKDNVGDTYVDEINTIVYNKFLMSKLILENDYYSKIIKKSS